MLIRTLVAASCFVPTLVAQAECTPGVTTNVDWVLPGGFDKAVERAKREHKLILIKGVSFGIDEVGAKCATKGKW